MKSSGTKFITWSKRGILALALIMVTALSATAQEERKERRRHFSPEEFQAKQREFITEKAGLSQQEAEAFFPLFFELQKKKFDIEHNARKAINKKRGEKMSDEQCRTFISKMAETRVEIAKLEQTYIGKYLEVISPSKLLEIQYAEGMFQRHLMKEMMHHRDRRERQNEKR